MDDTSPAVRSEDIEQSLGRKVMWRLVLPCAVFMLMGSLDRNNVSVAALHMNEDLGLSGAQYGFGAGVLFVGYLAAKYPSVLLLERVGFRIWLALITLLWGVSAFALGLVTNEWELYTLRVILGFGEGGLSSGLILYLSHWAPDKFRASILSIPIMSIPMAQVIGGPISGILLDLDDPFGITSWRFMFFVEAIPAVIIGIVALFWFPDTPEKAKWLTSEERTWLKNNVTGAVMGKGAAGSKGRWAALTSPIGWICAFIWFCLLAANYGIIFWLPQILQGMSDLTPTEIGFLIALPNIASIIAIILNARHSDKTQERVLHVAIPSVLGGAGLLVAMLFGANIPGLIALIFGGGCIGATIAAFWAIPTKLLPPESLAMGVVLINVVGALSGVTIPALIGMLRETTGSFLPPTLLIFALSLVCGILCLMAGAQLKKIESREAAVA